MNDGFKFHMTWSKQRDICVQNCLFDYCHDLERKYDERLLTTSIESSYEPINDYNFYDK
jgi:hypothetical protein